MIGSILQNRYQIEEELGRGGMGVVYRAHDRVLNRPVAIKVISESGMGSTGRARLLAEAQAVARLNHPNIVAVYDAGESENVTYLVMELLEGSSLRSMSELSLTKALDVAIQICSALEQAHASGIIHRDLKPENIFVTPSRTPRDSPHAKLMDFGLARRVDAAGSSEHPTQVGTLVGTVAYIAPEIIRGEPAGPLSDLYSLGLVLYEMVTGHPAYSGQDLISILSQHLHATVKPPSTYNPAVPADLEALILRLLEKMPEHRPASAEEVRLALEALRSGQPLDLAARSAGAPLDRIVRGRLVAREHELGEAWAHWKRAAQGEGRMLLISGEPGIGKTRLVKELLTRAALSGGVTLFGECQAHGGAPYAPVAQTIEQALLVGENAPDLPPLVLADLTALAPGLIARYDLPPNPALDPQAEQQRLFSSYASLCERLAGQAPLLLVLDDAHWADRGSLDVFHNLARRAARSRWRILIVLTYREVELSEARSLNEMLVDLGRERLPGGAPFATRLKLTRFSLNQTGALLESLLAEPVTDKLRDSIFQETEGNPFFIEEVVKTLIEEGKIYRANGRWELAQTEEILVPQSVRVAIEGRIARLPDTVQDTLRMAAIFGRRFDFETLRQAGEQSEDDLIEAIEQAQRVQLIEEVGGGHGGVYVLAFTHALIPAALVEGLSGLRRRRLHRKVIEVISRLHPEDYESLAHHCAEAAEDAQALEYLIKAADRARRLYANADAIRLYSEALALLAEKAVDAAALQDGEVYRRRFDLLARRAEVYNIQARRAEQLADIQAMLEIAGPQALNDPARHCDALLAFFEHSQSTGQGDALAAVRQALKLADQLNDPARQGQAYSALGHIYMVNRESIDSRDYFHQAIERLRAAGLMAAVAQNLNWVSLVERNTGRIEEAQRHLEEAIAISRQIGDRRLEGLNLRRKAIHLMESVQFAEALPLAQQALDLHRQVGDRVSEVNALNVIALAYENLHDYAGAEEHYLRSLALAEEIDMQSGVFNVMVNLTQSYYPQQGEYEKALALLEDNLQRFREDENLLHTLLECKNDLLANLGQFEAALEIAGEVLKRNLEAGRGEPVFHNHMRMGYLLVELDRFAEAQTYYAQALQVAEQVQERYALSTAHWGLGFWYFRQGASLSGVLRSAPDSDMLGEAMRCFDACLDVLKDLSTSDVVGIEARMYRAMIQAELGDHAVALETIQPVRDYVANIASTRHFNAYLATAYVLALAGKSEAVEVLRPAYNHMLLIAENLHNPALRESYAKTVLIRHTVALWRQIAPPDLVKTL